MSPARSQGAAFHLRTTRTRPQSPTTTVPTSLVKEKEGWHPEPPTFPRHRFHMKVSSPLGSHLRLPPLRFQLIIKAHRQTRSRRLSDLQRKQNLGFHPVMTTVKRSARSAWHNSRVGPVVLSGAQGSRSNEGGDGSRSSLGNNKWRTSGLSHIFVMIYISCYHK